MNEMLGGRPDDNMVAEDESVRAATATDRGPSEQARDQDSEVRKSLAENRETAPEILYFLAEDAHPEVRRAIANNPSTPRKADILLAGDPQEAVRLDLARKIGRLAPDLNRTERTHLEKLTLEALALLAADVLPRIRQIIAEEIKTLDNMPPEMMLALARDVEIIVSAPVLECSPLLDDDALLEIINSAPVQGALSAISRRQGLAAPLCHAIAETDEIEAVTALLSNPSAQIREETLNELIDRAAPRKPWHRPLALRPDLSKPAVDRIFRFISTSLISSLKEANILSPAMATAVAERVGDRLTVDDDSNQEISDESVGDESDVEDLLAELHDQGRLNDEIICAHIDQNDRAFAVGALSLLTEIGGTVVEEILHSETAVDVIAICWHADLAMRTAIEYQIKIARLPTRDIIYAKNGIDYPRSPAEMKRRLNRYMS